MKAWALVAMVLLVACSREQEGRGETAAPAPASGEVGTLSAQAPSKRLPGGSPMKGEVSGLSGDITDLRVRITGMETIVELPTDVLFAFDSADLSPAGADPLRRTAALVAKGGAGDVRVVGHTDAKGEAGYNLELSLRRARSVAGWLASDGGVAAGRLKSEGRGEAVPVAPNERPGGDDDPEGRALNRRVEVAIPR